MEKKCAEWYRHFKPPPESKTYYPTEAEFSDPITYVEQIRAEGEKFGVVKVVPPASFKPPYILNDDTFQFKTRIQPLYGIDALCRNRIFFIHELKLFWKNAGREFQWPYINNVYIDFIRLRELVREFGGVDVVNKQRKWADFAQILGFARTDCVTLKDRYAKWIVPFEEHWPKREEQAPKTLDVEVKSKSHTTEERVKNDGQTTQRMSTRQSSSRMMAGTRGRKQQSSSTAAHAIVQENSCGKCSKPTNNEAMVTCMECRQEFHKACLSRMISSRLVREWKCPQCLVADVHEADFFFSDSDHVQSLRMFRDMANNFKAKHFGVNNHQEVSLNHIEREYWKRVGDFDSFLKVEYGADLLSSEISSGFPRMSDDIRNQQDSELRLEYAKHPWNLNNLPVLDKSVLGHVGTEISGMMIPWVYAGMCFSTFCWHVEDHWTYSMNYMHCGETKVWYGFSEQYAEKFDALIKKSMPALFDRSPDLLHHMNTTVNPMFLMEHGIPVYCVRQNVNEFVITFPRAYHAGFNTGFNVAEAVNFAPPDWLAVGRRCVESYTLDQRRCVFAHDELVLRIAQTEQRLDIKTCRAVISELMELLVREQEFRSALLSAGVRKSEACDFEYLDDDHRSCVVCQTTLFITALRCNHPQKGLACSRHWERLCTECSLDECVIKYRYSLKQLSDFADRLTKRVEAVEEWQNVLNETLKNGQKISASDAKALMDSFNSQNLFECNEQMHLEKQLINYRTFSTKAQRILRLAVRLRDDTRCQRVDDRMTLDQLDTLITDLDSCLIEDTDLLEKLKKRRTQIKEWQVKVLGVVEEMRQKLISTQPAQVLEKFKSEGEAFNVRLEEIDILAQLMDYSQWHVETLEVIQKHSKSQNYPFALIQSMKREVKVGINNNSARFNDDARVSHEKLLLLVERGTRLSQYVVEAVDLFDSLQKINNYVNDKHKQILSFMATKPITTFADIVAFNKSILDLDWLSSNTLDDYREKFKMANEAWTQFMDLEQSPDFYYDTLDQVIEKFQRSVLMVDTHPHQHAVLARKLLLDFTREVNSVFLPSLTYYSTFEVLAAREDIPSIIEGGPEALYRQPSDSGFDNWTDLKRFETEDDMCNHVNQLFIEQRKLLVALRQHNQRTPAHDTCLRAPNCIERTDNVLTCFICCAKDHVSCAAWNKLLRRYPPGLYLCVRCCRSNRPDRKTVRQLIHKAPVRARESTFLQTCASKIFHMLDRLKRATDCTVYESGLTPLHVALAMEIHDDEVMSELFCKFLPSHAFSFSDIRIWNQLALNEPSLPLCICGYDDSCPIKKRRSRLRRSSVSSPKKQKLATELDEKIVVCGAAGCIMPEVASKVRWVMCEAGCSRWFHYICVNLNVKTVNLVQQYKCADCQQNQMTSEKVYD